MVRSLSFIHLFVILAVSYIGGALLFREIPMTEIERLIAFYDVRVVQGHDAGYIRPIGTSALFFLVVFALASFGRTRFLVLFFGAVKCVFFGLSSSYLLGAGTKIMVYSIWWFPFQFIGSFLFLMYCVVLCPPFFMTRTVGKSRNSRALTTILGLSAVIIAIEIIVFRFIL